MWARGIQRQLRGPAQRGSQVDKGHPPPPSHITMATSPPNMEFCAKHHTRVRAAMGTPALGGPTAQGTPSGSLPLLAHA